MGILLQGCQLVGHCLVDRNQVQRVVLPKVASFFHFVEHAKDAFFDTLVCGEDFERIFVTFTVCASSRGQIASVWTPLNLPQSFQFCTQITTVTVVVVSAIDRSVIFRLLLFMLTHNFNEFCRSNLKNFYLYLNFWKGFFGCDKVWGTIFFVANCSLRAHGWCHGNIETAWISNHGQWAHLYFDEATKAWKVNTKWHGK